MHNIIGLLSSIRFFVSIFFSRLLDSIGFFCSFRSAVFLFFSFSIRSFVVFLFALSLSLYYVCAVIYRGSCGWCVCLQYFEHLNCVKRIISPNECLCVYVLIYVFSLNNMPVEWKWLLQMLEHTFFFFFRFERNSFDRSFFPFLRISWILPVSIYHFVISLTDFSHLPYTHEHIEIWKWTMQWHSPRMTIEGAKHKKHYNKSIIFWIIRSTFASFNPIIQL